MPPTMPATRDAFPQPTEAVASRSGISSSLKGSPLPTDLLGGCDHQRNSSARKPLTEFEGLEQSVLLLAHKSGLHNAAELDPTIPVGWKCRLRYPISFDSSAARDRNAIYPWGRTSYGQDEFTA